MAMGNKLQVQRTMLDHKVDSGLTIAPIATFIGIHDAEDCRY